MDCIVLPSNQPADRFYRGGQQISGFRGESVAGPRTPEDWVASTTSVRGHSDLGRTILPDGTLLSDAIVQEPLQWLGIKHVEAFGIDTKLLVKLLDAGQRLPVHAHPDGQFAFRHLGAAHGKAEAWYVLSGGEVFLGLRQDVSLDELSALVRDQRIEDLLALMHAVPVEPHQTVYVPPGVLHAIGEGVLIAELQEPEDLSILLEWRDFELDGLVDGHLGLGFDTALTAVELRGRSQADISTLVWSATTDGSVLARDSAVFFRLHRYRVNGHQKCEPGFAVLIVIEGDLELVPAHGRPLHLPHGSTVVVPNGAGTFVLSGSGTALIARPPVSP